MRPVYFIGAGPGDPELLTIKGRRLLDEAEVIVYAGSLVNPALLPEEQKQKSEKRKRELYDSAGMTLEETTSVLREAALAGRMAVRLHSGDISFYSAAAEQMALLEKDGIDCVVVPGVSSLGAGAAALGAELTIPEVSQTVIVTRMAGRTPVPPAESIAALAAHKSTMVIFLSAGMMEGVVSGLLEGGYAPLTPAAVVERASWPEERVITGSLEDIASKAKEAGIQKTALIFVGEALSRGDALRRSRLYSGDFSHGYRKSDSQK